MSAGITVGVVANPASGRDIRRLVAGASVFDNAEKGNMVRRLMTGLGAAGVDRVLMMPAGDGIAESLTRNLRGRTGALREQPLPELEFVAMPVRNDAGDTVRAVAEMRERDVAAIAVLGGDGTHRLVARHCADVPLCALSTGTNNAFPEMREATVAGLATGLVATGQVERREALRREKVLRVGVNGAARYDCALIDVAVTRERWTGARALWHAGEISEVFVSFARPNAVGLSSIAGLLDPISRSESCGMHLRLTAPEEADAVLRVPLAPGLIVPVGVEEARRMYPGEAFPVEADGCTLALDGEREIELGPGDRAEVRLEVDGPLTIDVDAVMELAARRGLLNGM
ncbi:ATP-NAD kinase [Rubrobacter taiwanensis]|uniref:ATP-NAD kinase n=1 Tax=Rubrobacter taiwanensis TaxID=185139 RepID=A0A4R1BQE0_9ACTN|nr:NAD(+)/NADH kinase [Rubrobacter taiwanensis]TCJ19914.1 ATP-NAD kinase [Rubrobacter taiwanensis]